MCHSLLLALLLLQQPQLSNPKAIEPPGQVQPELGMLFEAQNWIITLEPLSHAALAQHFQELGVEPELLQRADLKQLLLRTLAFKINIENRGNDLLVFNSDQAMLFSKRGPDGFLLDMAHFWPTDMPRGYPALEKFARAFAKGTIHVEPGKQHQQLLVFRPAIDRFHKKVKLQLNRLYYGIEGFRVECAYQVRYR